VVKSIDVYGSQKLRSDTHLLLLFGLLVLCNVRISLWKVFFLGEATQSSIVEVIFVYCTFI
jgi:hypothetical protein